MDRRDFVRRLSAAATAGSVGRWPLGRGGWPGSGDARTDRRQPPDVVLHIATAKIEIAPGRLIKTTAYNGSVPGPLIRVPEGRATTIEVHNDTSTPELVHWHGLMVGGAIDGAVQEGTPFIRPHEVQQITIVPHPPGTRWYHTHTEAGRDLDRATYTGQFGFLYVEPRQEPAPYDDEVFLALHGWDGYLGTAGGSEGTLDVIYRSFTVNDRMLGAGDPIRVRPGRRVMLRILNANATLSHRVALSGHRFRVVALDGNPVPSPRDVSVLELGPAERVDAIVTMNQPGVWVLGETNDDVRGAGLGIVVEYAGQSGEPRWTAPVPERWDYTAFGRTGPISSVPDATALQTVPLVFKKKFAGSRWVDYWTVNDKSFPHTDPVHVTHGARYRLQLDNRSDEAHPIHLHRNTFELATVVGVRTAGVRKDVVVVPPRQVVEVDFMADALGSSLLHCHNQLHMDYGFMTIVECG